MLTSMWCMSLMALLVVDLRTGALQQKESGVRRCYFCSQNETACDSPSVTECSGDRPLCASFAVAPNFTSTLSCGVALKAPCSLFLTTEKTLELICTCTEDLCNAPYSINLQNQLLNFSFSNFTQNNSSDYTDDFFKAYLNISHEEIYKAITIPTVPATETPENSSHITTIRTSTVKSRTTLVQPVEIGFPRAEALKHEATEPSDDDEDGREGSGAYEDTRSQRQPPASDPAAPSSFLPADNNKATALLINFLLATPLLLYIIV